MATAMPKEMLRNNNTFLKTIILTIILIMEAKYMIVELIVKQKTLLLSA